jgi:molybdopterin converting factor small subunit
VLPAGATTADLLHEIGRRHGDRLVRVAAACSLLVDGRPDHARAAVLVEGATVDLLPPFAGG